MGLLDGLIKKAGKELGKQVTDSLKAPKISRTDAQRELKESGSATDASASAPADIAAAAKQQQEQKSVENKPREYTNQDAMKRADSVWKIASETEKTVAKLPEPEAKDAVSKLIDLVAREKRKDITLDKVVASSLLSDSKALLVSQYTRVADDKGSAPDKVTDASSALGQIADKLELSLKGINSCLEKKQQVLPGSAFGGLMNSLADEIDLQIKSGKSLPEMKLKAKDIEKFTKALVEKKDGKFVPTEELDKIMSSSIEASRTYTALVESMNAAPEGPARLAASLRLAGSVLATQ